MDADRAPRAGWRFALATVLAFADMVLGGIAVLGGSGDCSSEATCATRDAVLALTTFGGWAAVLVAAVTYAARRGRSRRPMRAPNAALAVTTLLLFAMPLYATFAHGRTGVTATGREGQHADARERIVRVVDETVAAIAPGARPRVSMTPGTRDPNDTTTCFSERYSVVLPAATPGERRRLADAAAAYWEGRGFAVERGFTVHARSGSTEFSLVDDRDFATVYGSGPCLRE